MAKKNIELTVTPSSPIEDRMGNEYSSIFLIGGINGTDFNNPEKDFIGWYLVPFKSKEAYESGKQPLSIIGINGQDNNLPEQHPRNQNPSPSFGARVGSDDFLYEVEQDEITKKVGLSSASIADLVEKSVKPTILGLKNGETLVLQGATIE